jgi:hypothetical protein
MEARVCCDARYGSNFCESVCLWIKGDAEEEEDSNFSLYLLPCILSMHGAGSAAAVRSWAGFTKGLSGSRA